MSQMGKTQATSRTGTGEKTLRVFSEFVLDYKMSGLFVRYPRVYTHKHIPPNIPPTHTYTLVTVVAECVLSFAWLPHTSAECQLSFLFCTWRMWGEWWGEQKHQTTKKVPNNAAIFAASTAASVSLISPSSSSLSLCPPRPPSTFTLPHRISLSSALESSS